jgi:hypothetical protein
MAAGAFGPLVRLEFAASARLGPRRHICDLYLRCLRLGDPGGALRRGTTSLWWNKVLWASPFFVDVRSGVDVGPVRWCTGIFCFLLCLSGVGYVDGRVLVVLCGREEHSNNISGYVDALPLYCPNLPPLPPFDSDRTAIHPRPQPV